VKRRALVGPLIVAAMLVAAEGADGKPHRWVDEHGTVHYSDQPPPPPAEAVSPPTGRPSEPPGPAPAPAAPAPPPPPPPEPPTTSPRPGGPPAAASVRPPEPEPPRLSAPPQPGASEAVREIIDLSGLDHWIDYLANSARGEFGRYRWQIAKPEAAWAALSQAFGRDALAATVGQALMRTVEPHDVGPLLAWLRSPLSRKITELQAALTNPARQHEYRTFVTKLPDARPPAARLALIHRLERERQVTEFQLELAGAARASVARVLAPLQASTGRVPGVEDTDDTRPRGEDGARFHAVTLMLFAYRNLTDGELDEYVRFSESPAGRRSLTIYEESLREAVRVAEQRAAAALQLQASPAVK
jgi:hypothetical protein